MLFGLPQSDRTGGHALQLGRAAGLAPGTVEWVLQLSPGFLIESDKRLCSAVDWSCIFVSTSSTVIGLIVQGSKSGTVSISWLNGPTDLTLLI